MVIVVQLFVHHVGLDLGGWLVVGDVVENITAISLEQFLVSLLVQPKPVFLFASLTSTGSLSSIPSAPLLSVGVPPKSVISSFSSSVCQSAMRHHATVE